MIAVASHEILLKRGRIVLETFMEKVKNPQQIQQQQSASNPLEHYKAVGIAAVSAALRFVDPPRGRSQTQQKQQA
jgi:hypothetical protein